MAATDMATGGLISALICGVALCYYFLRRSPTKDRPRVVVVSGAASGLGRATCLALAKKGDRVVALDINSKGLASLAQECHNRILTIACDVSDWEDVVAKTQGLPTLFSELFDEAPSFNIDSVVNLAGLIRGGPLMEIPAADVSLVMRVNVEGTHNLNRALFKWIRRAGEGADPKIFIVASEVSYAMLSTAMNAPYCMLRSKHMPPDSARSSGAAGWPCERILVNPGAHATPLLLNQLSGGSNAFFERHRKREGGSLWDDALAKEERWLKSTWSSSKKPEEFGRQDGLSHSYAVEKMRRSRADQRISANAGC